MPIVIRAKKNLKGRNKARKSTRGKMIPPKSGAKKKKKY